jgi:transposase
MSRPTIAIHLSKQERRELENRIRQISERKMADRLRVILYKSDGHDNKWIARMLQMGRNQVAKLLRRYSQGGIEALLQPDQYLGSQPKLSQEQLQALKIELTTQIYSLASQVIAWIECQWQIRYDLSSVHKLLKRLDFTYKKNRLVPSKADPELQRLFVQWYAGLCKRLGMDDRIYFGDAVHFKHNAEAGYAWSLKGKPHLIPSNSGRQRYNVLGAYCPHTHEYVVILTEDNINQDKLVELLGMLHDKHPQGRVYLVLDNARYNHAQQAATAAEQHRIRLEFLPPYSPNLNPIERLWKFVRKEFFKDKYRDTFAKFRAQLDNFFADLNQYRDQLASLITDNFELIPDGWQCPPSV